MKYLVSNIDKSIWYLLQSRYDVYYCINDPDRSRYDKPVYTIEKQIGSTESYLEALGITTKHLAELERRAVDENYDEASYRIISYSVAESLTGVNRAIISAVVVKKSEMYRNGIIPESSFIIELQVRRVDKQLEVIKSEDVEEYKKQYKVVTDKVIVNR